MIVLTARGLATNMAGPYSKQRQQIFSKPKRFMGIKTALWLWPLVLYSLIQIATNLIIQISQHENNNNEENYSTTTRFLNNYISSNNNNNILFTLNQVSSIQPTTKSHKLCSSTFKISSPSNPLLSSLSYLLSPSSTLNNDYHHHKNYFSLLLRLFNNYRTLFGGRVLLAEAASAPSSIPYQLNHDKGIIVLNSTNFNRELIQNKHPFPHIKLIEYFVSFCGYCRDFKATYNKLAKEIYPWRNVIRPSAIDLSISSNSPIAHSWSVQEVPTLRIHPPPEPSLAEKLDKQLTSSSATLSPIELQKAMFEGYNSSKLMIQSLKVSDYKDKVPLLKQDLLRYIERYVQEKPTEVPFSWPNLRPVTETSLVELRLGHPRQELFLIIDGTAPTTSDSDQSSASMTTSFGFNLIMELSSSATWKAIRYARASENKALIEDVISQQNKSIIEHQENQVTNQIKLLKNLLSNEPQPNEGNNDILLLHIDDSHSPIRSEGSSTAFPFMTLVTGVDLMTIEKSMLGGHNNNRVKREIFNNKLLSRFKRGSEISSLTKISDERKIELFASYIKEAYTETSEDREFVEAINNFDDLLRAEDKPESASKVLDKYIKSQKIIQKSNPTTTATIQDSYQINTDQSTLLDKIQNILKPAENQKLIQPSYTASGDYEDKVKALRYILFTEVPRISTAEKSLVEQQEKLNTLVNLVTVIRLYFPFADSSSVEFIDGVQSYLLKQQSRLLSVKTQEVGSSGFDTRAFKQELKRLESENKRLPEIKDWKHCTGYPCALWRLFHTLTAFEYMKVKQIRQLLQQPPQQQQQQQQQSITTTTATTTILQQREPPLSTQPTPSTGLQQSENPFSNSVEVITMKSTNSDPTDVRTPPVERVVSPPSTTTSLSLTIATQNSSQVTSDKISNNNNSVKPLSESDLPMPVILVMRDYITTFFSCSECAVKFRAEAAELSLEKIRHEEPAEFSILWLWETHNRINKRLSVDVATNPPERPKLWFPSYSQCASCYKKPPSFLKDTTVDSVTIFHESLEWNKQEILSYLLSEYTKQPLNCQFNIFSDHFRYSFKYIVIGSMCCLILIVFLRCTTFYVERQRRHKATLLNGNGAHYSVELQ